jgi:hypothetical protein
MFDVNGLMQDQYVSVDDEAFTEALEAYGLYLEDYLFHDDFPQFDDEEDFVIYLGDIRRSGDVLRFPGYNVLVIGSVEATVIDLYEHENGDEVEGATLQVTGDVKCRDLNHGFERFTVIGGDLTVKRFMNLDYEDSDFVVLGDATIEFLGGNWVTCGGTANINYGDGSAIGLDFWDLPEDERGGVSAKHDEAASSAMAGFDIAAGDVRDNLCAKIFAEG